MQYVNECLSLLLILSRVVGFIVSAPLFGTKFIQVKVKIYLAVLLTVILWSVNSDAALEEVTIPILIFMSVCNILIGMLIGMLMKVALHFLTLGGHIIAMGSGLGFATLADPVNGNQVTTIASFYKMLGNLLFVFMGGGDGASHGGSKQFRRVSVTTLQYAKNNNRVFIAVFYILF